MKNLKKIFNIIALVIIAISITNCKDKKEEEIKIESITVKPKTTVIKGDLGDYFVVVNQDYKIELQSSFSNEGLILVEVKRTNKDFDFSVENINPFGTNGDEKFHVGFGIEVFNSAGPKVIKQATGEGLSGPYSSEDVTALMNLGKGDTGFIRWNVEMSDDLKTFQISSAIEKSDDSVSEHSAETVLNSGSEDYDKMLNDYEEYVAEYVKLYKKAIKGDNSALSEYPAMMEKATNLQESMQKAQTTNQLSANQIVRMAKIQTKMVQAMQ